MKPFQKIVLTRQVSGISSTQKLILLLIATHIGNNEFAFISLDTLMEESCIKKRTSIVEGLNILSELELIIKLEPSNGYKSSRYGLNFKTITNNVRSSQEKIKQEKKIKNQIRNEKLKQMRINKAKNKKDVVTDGNCISENDQEKYVVTDGYLCSHLRLLV